MLSGNSGLVGVIVGGAIFIVSIIIAISVCIIICSRAHKTGVVAGPQTVTAAAVVVSQSQPVEVPLQQVPQKPSAPYAPCNQNIPPYNPNPTGYNGHWQEAPLSPPQPGYFTSQQQPPPYYYELVQENCPAGGASAPYPV